MQAVDSSEQQRNEVGVLLMVSIYIYSLFVKLLINKQFFCFSTVKFNLQMIIKFNLHYDRVLVHSDPKPMCVCVTL